LKPCAIRVHKTGICGTDLHIYEWDDCAAKTIPVPMVVGHEFVGEVVAFGSNVSDFAVGDLVTGEGHVAGDPRSRAGFRLAPWVCEGPPGFEPGTNEL
jgi:threonine dehydrogenase-like Zn-dependent dehydrogenase